MLVYINKCNLYTRDAGENGSDGKRSLLYRLPLHVHNNIIIDILQSRRYGRVFRLNYLLKNEFHVDGAFIFFSSFYIHKLSCCNYKTLRARVDLSNEIKCQHITVSSRCSAHFARDPIYGHEQRRYFVADNVSGACLAGHREFRLEFLRNTLLFNDAGPNHLGSNPVVWKWRDSPVANLAKPIQYIYTCKTMQQQMYFRHPSETCRLYNITLYI